MHKPSASASSQAKSASSRAQATSGPCYELVKREGNSEQLCTPETIPRSGARGSYCNAADDAHAARVHPLAIYASWRSPICAVIRHRYDNKLASVCQWIGLPMFASSGLDLLHKQVITRHNILLPLAPAEYEQRDRARFQTTPQSLTFGQTLLSDRIAKPFCALVKIWYNQHSRVVRIWYALALPR